ncbi:MAG: zinc ribbon domain-containing protein, partial [Candidatus Altiarchaeota archaeon]
MKCPKCGSLAQEKWSYCPECGFNLIKISELFTDPRKYLSFRGENLPILCDNFTLLGGINILPGAGIVKARKTLSDTASVNLFQLQVMALISYSPILIEDVFRVARLMGYYMVYPSTQKFAVNKILQMVKSREQESWKIPANNLIVDYMRRSWRKNKIGLVEEVTPSDGEIHYKIREVGCSIKAINSEYCSLVANLSGMAEALTGEIWAGRLGKCGHECDGCCEVIIHPGDEKFIKEDLSQKEYGEIQNEIINSIATGKQKYPREKLGPDFHISLHQTLNYLLLKASPGHRILYKHCAVKAGEQL